MASQGPSSLMDFFLKLIFHHLFFLSLKCLCVFVTGVKGEKGSWGLPGSKGEKGDQGAQGPPGMPAPVLITQPSCPQARWVLVRISYRPDTSKAEHCGESRA